MNGYRNQLAIRYMIIDTPLRPQGSGLQGMLPQISVYMTGGLALMLFFFSMLTGVSALVRAVDTGVIVVADNNPVLQSAQQLAVTMSEQPVVAHMAVTENVVVVAEQSGEKPQIISPLFTAEVQRWAPLIADWAAVYELDPNLVALVMQIESCGHPKVHSTAGAQGLFQVMPFHFADGEDMLDPHTNAQRGLAYLAEQMRATGGDIGRSLAGYNGGHRAAQGAYSEWPQETKRYYYWGMGIYADLQQGNSSSSRLQEWLDAGGASLCRQAAEIPVNTQ